jgi:hypothetical protein
MHKPKRIVESNKPVFQFQNAVIGNGDPMGVAAKVLHYLGCIFERRFAICHPIFLIQAGHKRVEMTGNAQIFNRTVKNSI